jgi:hypothetical protein
MVNTRNRFPGRRKFLKQSAALSANAASWTMPLAALAAVNKAAAPSAPPAQDLDGPGAGAPAPLPRKPMRGGAGEGV